MNAFTTILALIFLVFGILQIILFFKIWGMTNNIDRIKDLLEKLSISTDYDNSMSTDSSELSVGDTVVRIDGEEQFKIIGIDDNGMYSCSKAGIPIGSFKRSELYTWAEWLEHIK